MNMTLEQQKAYLGECWVLSKEYRREDNPAHTFRDGAYWLQPENIDVARIYLTGANDE